jgi:hypothetical protein
MSKFDYYLTSDHVARTKTAILSILMGAVAGIVSEVAGMPSKGAAVICLSVVGIVEITSAFLYVLPIEQKRRKSLEPESFGRRSLIFAPISALLFLLLTLLPTPKIEAAVIERRLKNNANDPDDPQNIKETRTILAQAETWKIRLRPSVVENAGKKFIQAAQTSPDAWDAALSFANYRSSTSTNPHLGELQVHADTRYKFESVTEADMQMYHYGKVPIEQAARLNPFGQDLNLGKAYGDKFLVVAGGDLHLDDLDIKQVVFRQVNIVYRGGHVRIEDAYFINCTLFAPNTPNGQKLLRALLESSAINFVA